MTYKELKKIISKNQISEDVKLMSNSGWECGATNMEGIFYSPSKNEIHFVSYVLEEDEYDEDYLKSKDEKAHDWVILK